MNEMRELFDKLNVKAPREFTIDEYRSEFNLNKKEFCERFNIKQSEFSDSRRQARFENDVVQAAGNEHSHMTVNSRVILED